MEYQGWVNPYGANMGDLIARSGDAQAHAAEVIAQANARAAVLKAGAWSGAVQNLANLPAQIEQSRNAEVDRKLKQQELEQRTQQLAAGQQQRIVTTIGRIAGASKSPEEFSAGVDDLVGLKALPPDVAAHIKQQATAAGPDGWGAVQSKYTGFAQQFMEAQKLGPEDSLVKDSLIPGQPATVVAKGAGKPIVLPPTPQGAAPATLVPSGGGAPLATGGVSGPKPMNEAELAADAATAGTPTETPTAKRSAAAMAILKPPPAPRPIDEQLLEAIAKGDTEKAGQITEAMQTAAAARRDPAASSMARELGNLRADEARQRLDDMKKKAEPIDISPDIQTTRAGRSYVDLSLYGAGERSKARQAANDNGAVPVSKEQANALQEIDNARLNQQSIKDQITDLLPKSIAGRGLSSVTVPLSKMFQTNDQISAFNSWRTAAIQTLRATAGSKGLRINQAEIAQSIENDIPKLTDTVGTAQQKFKNIESMLENAEQSILVRDRRTTPPDAGLATPPTLTPGLKRLQER